MNSLNLLKDKVAIVTGGTCEIGYQIAKTYLKNGAKVALFGSSEEAVNKVINQLKAENPTFDVIGYFPKLTDYTEIESAVLRVKEVYGKIDILVNNAGISEDNDVIENVNACPTNAVISIMKEQGGGVIVNTSSIYSEEVVTLARELGKDNIKVNAVILGVIKTVDITEQEEKEICANIPLGKMGEPEDVANAVLFLASDLASYITGATLRVGLLND